MGQQECIKLLEKNKNKWLTTTKISTKLKKEKSQIMSLNRLLKHGEVVRKQIREEGYYVYAWKIR